MERTRILLAEMPRMLRDIVTGILAEQPDMEVVEEARRVTSLPEAVERIDADVVVVGRYDPRLATELVSRRPRLKVLAVSAGGHEAWLYELQPQRVSLGEISPARLVEEIRKRARAAKATWWTE